MALPPSRQRRAFAPPSPSYPTPTAHPPSQPRSPALLSDLPSRWRRARTAAATPLAQRLAMRALEVALLSLALFLVPACIQHFVRALDTTYEVVGRRARTSLDEVGWWRVGVGTGLLAAWHAVLVALSLRVIAGGGERGRRGKWSRVLGRVVVPGYLVVALVGFAYALATRMASPLVVPGQAYGHASTPHG